MIKMPIVSWRRDCRNCKETLKPSCLSAFLLFQQISVDDKLLDQGGTMLVWMLNCEDVKDVAACVDVSCPHRNF